MQDIRHASEDNSPERSIRNVTIGRRAARHQAAIERDHSHAPPELPHRRPRRLGRFWWIAIGVVAVCAIFGVLLSTVFAGATVTIYPRTEAVQPPATLQAQQNAPVGVLQYQILSVTRSASQSVSAQGVQHVSRAASGVITITNNYSGASQRLIANTRFEAPDGKIYRVRDSVTVPGMAAGKPGTVTATVYADSPGPDYNKSAATTFVIPGFKGDPRYTKFSAESQGAISGGFIGDEPAVAPADLAAAKTALQKQVDGDVRAAAASQIPQGSVAIPGTLTVSFADIIQVAGSGNTATLTQSATATGGLLRQADLAAAIARSGVTGYKGEAVLFGDASKMSLMASTSTKLSDGTLTLQLGGTATLVWQFDPNALLQALVGKDKSEFQTTIQTFQPAVAKADASIRPFWQGKFPSDPAKIKIKIGNL
jgi:hypothetical protein